MFNLSIEGSCTKWLLYMALECLHAYLLLSQKLLLIEVIVVFLTVFEFFIVAIANQHMTCHCAKLLLFILEHPAPIHLITMIIDLNALHAFGMVMVLQVLTVYTLMLALLPIIVRLIIVDLIRSAHMALRDALVSLLVYRGLLQLTILLT